MESESFLLQSQHAFLTIFLLKNTRLGKGRVLQLSEPVVLIGQRREIKLQ